MFMGILNSQYSIIALPNIEKKKPRYFRIEISRYMVAKDALTAIGNDTTILPFIDIRGKYCLFMRVFLSF